MRFTGKARWRPRHTPGKMNKTEARFAERLELRKITGDIHDYMFEPAKFRLGKDWKTSYCPDFMVLRTDGEIELIDVKGGAGWEAAARVKIKAAAAQYPMFRWLGHTEYKHNTFGEEEF